LEKVKDFMVEVRNSVRSIASRMAVHADVVCVLLVVAFSTLLFFVNLGNGPLWAADEQTYSQWGFHMAKTGDYLTPWAFGVTSLWIGKPPLYFWLMALAYQVFGISNFSTRFWSPVFGVLSCVVIFYLGKKLHNRTVGLLAVLVLSTFFTFYAFARHAMLDVPFIFFMLASIFLFVLSEEPEKSNRFTILGGLSFGLALITKQTTALLIPLIVGSYFALTRRSIRSLFSKRFALFLGVGTLVISPWLIYMVLQFGPRFWYVYLLYNNVMRTVTPLEGHVGGFFFYLSYLVTSENSLWIVILPLAVAFSVFNSFYKRSRGDTLLVVWMIVVLGVFTIAQTKLYWYILPAFPAFAIVIGSFLYSCFKKLKASSDSNRSKSFRPS
jgi:4-amino-4-deoxy-L-arabinose transferase-like glycosyltransferase